MEKKQHSCPTSASFKYCTAALFIIAGTLLLGRNFGWIAPELFNILFSWQMLIMIIGLHCLIRKNWCGGIIMLTIGFCFLSPMLNLPWLPMDKSQLIWPVMLIIVGVSILGKVNCRPKPKVQGGQNTKNEYTSTDGFVRSDNTFGSVHQVVLDEVFRGATIHNKFGGTIIDLRRTNIAEGETFIDLDCNFGGVEIYIPSHWKVDLYCEVIMGGCEDKRMPHPSIDLTRKLVIRGRVVFSGVEIMN